MILDDSCPLRPNIEYPCEWGYKIIGTDKLKLKACIVEVMGERDYTTKDGNSSSNGKFHSFNARCVVNSEEERYAIYRAFQEHQDIKIVI